jgi:signal peptidase I
MSAEVLDLATQRNLLAGEVVRAFGQMQLRVTGSSMIPTLWPGDLVRIERRAFESLNPGEIVFYLRDGRLFLHRLVASRETSRARSLTTRGDAMAAADPAVPENCFLGVATAVRRRGEWIRPRDVHRLLRWFLASSALMQQIILRVHSWWEGQPKAPLAETLAAKG